MGLNAAKHPTNDKAGLAARRAALLILSAILDDARPFDDTLMQEQAAGLAPRDRAFVTALVRTCLRRKGESEAIITRFLSKKLPRKSGNARLILLLGATQLLYLETPPHAAIDLAVSLAREDRDARHFANLINAVLRKLTDVKPIDRPRLNVPDWLWRRWAKTYGEGTAEAVARAHLAEPALDLSVKADPNDWARALNGIVLPTGSLRLRERSGAIEDLPGFGDGAWWVQDAAAALPARLLGEVAGRTVLDLCAAPGGKTAQLAARGARVTAVDQSAPRMERVRRNLDRLKLAAELHIADVLDFPADRLFDAVLLDAPCSATGTIRRHPELPFIKDEPQLAGLAILQARLLAHAAKLVRSGGSLVYCTCSLEPEEGEAQVESFLGAHADYRRRPLSPEDVAGESRFIAAQGDLRTLPSMNIGTDQGLDGFYAARLVRL
ncbi:MAG: RsmB/NOP family class I SAM-dependent RNA methyltransferase [Parvibaculaceae bacterium]